MPPAVMQGKIGPVGLSLKLSQYSADDFSVDITKEWLTASANFSGNKHWFAAAEARLAANSGVSVSTLSRVQLK